MIFRFWSWLCFLFTCNYDDIVDDFDCFDIDPVTGFP